MVYLRLTTVKGFIFFYLYEIKYKSVIKLKERYVDKKIKIEHIFKYTVSHICSNL